jgi:hypothetical protein
MPNNKIQWENNKEPDIMKYLVYMGEKSGEYSLKGETTENYLRCKDLTVGKTYYIVIKAVNKDGAVSGPSKEVSVKIYNRYIDVKTTVDGGKTYRSIGKVPYPIVKGQKYKTNIVTEK